MKVSEIAKRSGLSRDTIRHYGRLGLIKSYRDQCNGYQLFSSDQLSRLRFIKAAQLLGFKLKDIQLIFQEAEEGQSVCPQVRELIQTRLNESADKITALNELYARMTQAIEQWSAMPDTLPDGDSICRLIEIHIDKTDIDKR